MRPCRILLLVTGTLLALGCQQQSVLVPPQSFDRPGDVAFTCFDEEMGTFVSLDECQGQDPTSEQPGPVRLTALVIQTAPGEVGAVDLGGRGVVDADRRVPGFTFVRVGESPSGIAVRPGDNPNLTYVASFVAQRIDAVPTHRFHPDVSGTGGEAQSTDLSAAPAGLEVLEGSADANAGPSLFAPLPNAGMVSRVPLGQDGQMQTPEPVELEATVPDAVDLRDFDMLPPQSRPGTYRRICQQAELVAPPSDLAPREPTRRGDEPTPAAMAFARSSDGSTRIFVADESLPVVHVLRVAPDGTLSVQESINVGVPTLDVAVGPRVPARVDARAQDSPARYLYAIDAIDRSILVVDVLEGSPTYGAVLPVSARGGMPDRIEFGAAGARTLEVASPDFEPQPQDRCMPGGGSLDQEAGPDTLRGVFLTAGLTDGTVRVVDVHDLDIDCRGQPGCQNFGDDDDLQERIFVARHRPRIAQTVERGIAVEGTPSFRFDAVAGSLQEDGSVAEGQAPGLAPLTSCPQPGMAPAFPDSENMPPILCSLADPWTAQAQRWEATWQGPIPGTQGSRGRFDSADPTVFRATGSPFCERGVLGSEDAPAQADFPDETPSSFPELGYPGDALVITSQLPDSTADRPECQQFAGELQERDEIAFAIRSAGRAEDGRGKLRLGRSLGLGSSVQEVARCFPEVVEFRIRTRGVYTVVGSRSGFDHRVVLEDPEQGGTGRCRVDRDADPAKQGRAFAECLADCESQDPVLRTFVNRFVAFTIRPFDVEQGVAVPVDSEAELRFDVSNVPSTLAVHLGAASNRGRDFGVLPSELRFNPVDQGLYAVDTGQRRLIRLAFDPFRITLGFE
jgi:hypothetical protein